MDSHTDTTGKPRQRRYTDAEQADALAALDANAGCIATTSREIGIPEQTLRHWRDGDCRPCPPELVEQRKSARALAYDEFADRALAVAMDKVGELDAKAAIIASAVATDKALLLRGEATSITESRDDERVTRLRDRYAALRTRRPILVQPTAPPAPEDVPDATVPRAHGGEAAGEST